MRWKLTVIIGCVLAATSTIAILAQGSSARGEAAATAEQVQPSLRVLTRILRSPDRLDELEGALAALDATIASGNADAALLLGNEYTKDRGTLPLDYTKAVFYLEQAVALGIPEANLTLAALHRSEVGGLHRAKVLGYLRAAADAGLEQALMPLANALRQGTYDEPDIAQAITYYDAAFATGNSAAATRLASIYRAGTGSPDDGIMLAKYLGILADAGDIPARRTLADLYLQGSVVPQDLALAEQHLRAALVAGDDSAALALAGALLRGRLGGDREAEAVPLLQSAFDAGNLEAAAALANAYISGRGVAVDVPKALAILRTGVDSDNAAARATLFNLYVRGSGRALAPDPAAARNLYDTIPANERTGSVAASATILSADGRRLDNLAQTWARFDALDPALQANTGALLLRVNPNAYVYMLQGLMSERGHYSGALTGQLTTSTISAINQFCAEQDITHECRFGPLARSTWNSISAALKD